ncbi:MAG: LysR substrate-binding domain-containing protein [Pseudomonadota bacterium]
MEIRQLRYFVRIADLGSVSRAAEALHVAQPALSQQVAQLESELGQPLLVRRSTGVHMTEQGEVFYRHAQRILRELADVAGAVQQAGSQPCGSVALGLPQSTASHYAMPLLAALRAQHPGIEVEFFDEISGNLLQGVSSGRLDLAVLVNDEHAALLQAEPLLEETLYLVSRPELAPAQATVPLASLAQYPLALPGHTQGVRDLLERALQAQGASLPPPRVLANSMSIMRQAALAGLAHCVMPWAAIHEDLARGTLKATPTEPPLSRRAHLCAARDAALTLAGQAVRRLLRETVRQRVQSGEWPGVRLLP